MVPVSQKFRGLIGRARSASLPQLGGQCILFVRQARVELVCLRSLRRRLRVSLRRVRGLAKSRRLWLTVHSGFPVSLSSKGSRMGKGRGLFERWAFKAQALRPWARLAGFSQARSALLGLRLRALLGPCVRLAHQRGHRPSWARQGSSGGVRRQVKFN